MIKYKSTETGKEYDTLKEATEAEVVFAENKRVAEEETKALNEKIKKAYDNMTGTRKTLNEARRAYQKAVDEYYAIVDKRNGSDKNDYSDAFHSFFRSLFD